MKVRFLKALKENFGVRVFVAFACFISILSLSLAAFFIQHESQSMRHALIGKGTLLARILAQNARIGVFSENEKLLQDPVKGVFQQAEVLGVSVFNLQGALLKQEQKSQGRAREENPGEVEPDRARIFSDLRRSGTPFFLEHGRRMAFWAPVLSGFGYSGEESMILRGNPLGKKARVMGFVRITVDKTILNRGLKSIFIKSMLLCVAFLLAGSLITYLVVKSIAKPLNKLTEAAITFGMAGRVEKIPVKRQDQIGRLAHAFNTMSESLKKREEELQASEGRLRYLSFELLKAQENERMRISKELHDELGQALALLKHRVRSVGRKLYESQAFLREDCEETSRYIDQTIENVRRLSRDLSPAIIEDLGLSAALRWLAENFAEQYAIGTDFNIEPIDPLFSQDEQTNLYRIFQEALTNIGKHAGAGHVSFSVKRSEGHVYMVLEDDGKGFDPNRIKKRHPPQRGVGLAAMGERAHMLGASLDIRSRPGEGTTLHLTIPIDEKDELENETLSYRVGR